MVPTLITVQGCVSNIVVTWTPDSAKVGDIGGEIGRPGSHAMEAKACWSLNDLAPMEEAEEVD